MKIFCINPFVNVFILFLTLFFLTSTLSATIDDLLKTKNDLLNEDYKSKALPELDKLKQRLQNHYVTIRNELKKDYLTPEQEFVLQIAYNKLVAREGSVKCRIKKLSGGECEKIDPCKGSENYIKILEKYFIDRYSKKGLLLENFQNLFFQGLSECFEFLAQCPEYYEEAMTVIQKLAYDPEGWAGIIYDDVSKLDSLLNQIKTQGQIDTSKIKNLLKIQEIINRHADRDATLDEILKSLEKWMDNYNTEDIGQILGKMSDKLADSSVLQQHAEKFTHQISLKSTVDAKIFLSPLQQFINTVKNEQLLNTIFVELKDRYGTLDSTSTVALALRQLFKNEKESFIKTKDIPELLTTIQKYKETNKIQYKIYPAWRRGAPTETGIEHLITPIIREVWTPMTTAPVDHDTADIKHDNLIFSTSVGDKIDPQIFKIGDERLPVLHVFNTFNIEKRQLKVSQRIVNSEGMILGIFDCTNPVIDDTLDFKAKLKEKLCGIQDKFKSNIKDCMRIQELLGDFELNNISINQLKMLLLTNIKTSVIRHPGAISKNWQEVDGIFVYKPFFQTKHDQTAFSGLADSLKKRLQQRQPLLNVAIHDSETPGPRNITISARTTNQKNLQIEIEPTVVVNFTFERFPLKSSEIGYIVDFVVESIQAYLGGHVQNIPPAPISQYESIPSFLFAGTSHFSIANQIQPIKPGKVRKWGYIYGGLELMALVLAGIWDKQAIENLNNNRLRQRDYALGTAAGVVIISGFHALYDIKKHNKRVMQK